MTGTKGVCSSEAKKIKKEIKALKSPDLFYHYRELLMANKVKPLAGNAFNCCSGYKRY